MTFDQLYYFTKIYEEGSINAAANACYISYQAMSKSLRNLEHELDMPLMIRTHTGVSFTPEGRIFYEDCQKILQMKTKWTNLSRKVKNKQSSKNLRIFAVPFFSNYIFPDLIPKLEQQGYQLDYTSASLDLIEPLLENSIDSTKTVGLTCHFPPFPSNIVRFAESHNLEVCHLFSDTFLVYLNRDFFHASFSNANEIDAKDLWDIPYVENASLVNHLTPYASLQNPKLAKYKGYQYDVFELLKNNNLYTFMQASLKECIEAKHPYIIGVPIKNAPPLNIDYYLVYSQMISEQDRNIIEFIKDYFA